MDPAAYTHRAVEDPSPLHHSEDAEGFWADFLLRSYAAAVVADFDKYFIGTVALANADARGGGVADGVGQRLLHDAEKRSRAFSRRLLRQPLQSDVAMNAGPLLDILREPLDRRAQTEIIEQAGPQIAADTACLLDGRIEPGDRLAHMLRIVLFANPVELG